MSEKLLQVINITFLDKGPYSFSVGKGECVGLSGKSGIGKTQLFRALTDLIPAGGEILLEGTPCSAFTPTEWRSRVTMVPAESFWWYDKVGEHFTAAEQKNFLRESCVSLGLDPEIFGWQVSRLSTGERQRLALLRALQNKPTVLLLDEPSSGLDVHHTALLEAFIGNYRLLNQPAIVWVSHDPDQLRRVASREFLMEQNRLYVKT